MFKQYCTNLKFEWLERRKVWGAKFEENPYPLGFSYCDTMIKRFGPILMLIIVVEIVCQFLGLLPREKIFHGLSMAAWGIIAMLLGGVPILVEYLVQRGVYLGQLRAYRRDWTVRDDAVTTLVTYHLR